MTAPATPLSANEVRFFFTRAVVGAGAPYGIGEDMAGAALWLAAAGFDPAEILAPALTSLRDGESSGRLEAVGAQEARCLEVPGGAIASALFAGSALADSLALGPAASVLRVDVPLVVLAVLGAMRPELGWQVTISGESSETIVTLSAESLSCTRDFDSLAAIPGPARVHATRMTEALNTGFTRDLATGRARVIETGVTVGDAGWSVVQSCFRNCLVPSSAESRLAGAGAGLNDTD